MISLVWKIKNKTNEYICKTETDSDIENKHVVTKRESRGSACEYQADEQAGVARLSWRVSGR